MKFFIAYKVTGENVEELEKTIKTICSAIKEKGHEYYCTIEEESFEEKSRKDMMDHAFHKINDADALFVFINSEGKSEGMLMEIGYALGNNKKIILAINKKVQKTYLREIADKVIEFNNIEDIKDKIGESK